MKMDEHCNMETTPPSQQGFWRL